MLLLGPGVSAPHHLIIKVRPCRQWQIHVTPRIIPLHFQISVSQLTTPDCHPPIRSQLRYTYIMIGLVMGAGNVRQCRNIKILRTWKQLQSDIERSSYDHILVHCASVLWMVWCVSCQGEGTMRLDHVMVSIMYKSCELPQIIAWPVIIELWHWSGIVQHWHDIEH